MGRKTAAAIGVIALVLTFLVLAGPASAQTQDEWWGNYKFVTTGYYYPITYKDWDGTQSSTLSTWQIKFDAKLWPRFKGGATYAAGAGNLGRAGVNYNLKLDDFDIHMKVALNIGPYIESNQEKMLGKPAGIPKESLLYAQLLYRTIRFSESGGTALDYTYRTQGWGAGLGLEPDYTQQISPYASINFYPTMQTSGIIINGQGYGTHSIWDYNVGVVFNFKTNGTNNNWYGDLGWKGQNNSYKNANNTIRTDYSGPTIGVGVRW